MVGMGRSGSGGGAEAPEGLVSSQRHHRGVLVGMAEQGEGLKGALPEISFGAVGFGPEIVDQRFQPHHHRVTHHPFAITGRRLQGCQGPFPNLASLLGWQGAAAQLA